MYDVFGAEFRAGPKSPGSQSRALSRASLKIKLDFSLLSLGTLFCWGPLGDNLNSQTKNY